MTLPVSLLPPQVGATLPAPYTYTTADAGVHSFTATLSVAGATALLVNSERCLQERLLLPHPLQVRPVRANGTPGEPVTCRGKDISLSGIGFYLPHERATAEVAIDLPATPQSPALSVPATLVRAKRCADGWYEVGALFRLTALRKSNSRHSSLVTSHS